jgi:hypothetical protein
VTARCAGGIPDFDLKRYNKVLITRILVSLKADQQQAVDPTDLKALVDYFHNARWSRP